MSVEDDEQGDTSNRVDGDASAIIQVGRVVGAVHVNGEATPTGGRGRKVLRRTALVAGGCVLLVLTVVLLVSQLPRERAVAGSLQTATSTVSSPTGSSAAPAAAPKTEAPVRSTQRESTTAAPTTTSKSVTQYTEPPDLTGNWLLHFHQLNFGDNGTHDYTIAMHRLEDFKCGGTPPCYGGIWYSVEAKSAQGGNVVAMSSISKDGSKLVFLAIDTDSNGGKQTYNGTAPNDTSKQLAYTGDWSDTNGWAATFSFIRQA